MEADRKKFLNRKFLSLVNPLANFDNPTRKREQFAVGLRKQRVEDLLFKRRKVNNNGATQQKLKGDAETYRGVDYGNEVFAQKVEELAPGIINANISVVS